MNPCVKIFDVNRLKTVTTYFLDMCLTFGADGSTAESIFTLLLLMRYLPRITIPHLSLSADNTNNMNDWKEQFHGFNSRFLERNENFFISGCPYHVAHISASNSYDAFNEYIVLNVEDVMVDLC